MKILKQIMIIRERDQKLIGKLKELVEHYKAYYDSTKSPAVNITAGWEKYGAELEVEIKNLESESREKGFPF